MNPRIFRTAEFTRIASKLGIVDAMLIAAINRVEQGLIDADLGGGVLKLRIARPGGGRRGGFRTIVACSIGEKSFFVFAYGKNDMGNMSPKEVIRLRRLADVLLGLSDVEIARALEARELTEVNR